MAEACLGGLHGRSALLIGPERQLQPFKALLQQMGIKAIYQEETPERLVALLPRVQLLMHIPDPSPTDNATPQITATRSFAALRMTSTSPTDNATPQITAAAIARGCAGRHAPLVVFDLAETSSIEELAGLLPAVCLYAPDDLRAILARYQMQIA